MRLSMVATIVLSCTGMTLAGYGLGQRLMHRGGAALQTAWQKELQSASEESAAELVLSLRREGELAIATLVTALADRRPAVAQAAREAISHLVHDSRQLPAEQALPRLTKLARELAATYPRLSTAQQQFARQLADMMLAWPLDDADFLTDDLVAACESILRSPPPLVPADAGHPPTESPAGATAGQEHGAVNQQTGDSEPETEVSGQEFEIRNPPSAVNSEVPPKPKRASASLSDE
jgi:hypothetical protein